LGDIFEKTKNFEQLLFETNELKKRLSTLGCFSSVEVLIDSPEGNFF